MATDFSVLPKTRARQSTSIRLMVVHPTKGEMVIGDVDQFSRSIDRTLERRRAMDSAIPGETVEIMPGVTDLSLTIRRAVLYKSTLIEAVGFDNVEDLLLQNLPIDIREYRYDTNGNVTKVIRYEECYFSNNPLSYEISGALMVIQDVNLDVTRIRVTKS